ncbi:winged helix-turn-helix domain-containing protein [Kribbella sp. CA-245084]|uniref:winged helix-turn-helix domain-containing protein n=1 Tax=Kribbella sp. CA-245084 TaxID=3239940 RepID=UPI003D91F18B
MAIDRSSAQPLQAQVAEDIRRRIRTGEFAPGAKLPALRALTTEYDVAEMTVHAAIRELQREGVVISSRGRGTFVSDDIDVPALTGVYDQTTPEAQIADLRETVAMLTARVERLEAHDDKSTADPGAKP